MTEAKRVKMCLYKAKRPDSKCEFRSPFIDIQSNTNIVKRSNDSAV